MIFGNLDDSDAPKSQMGNNGGPISTRMSLFEFLISSHLMSATLEHFIENLTHSGLMSTKVKG